MLCSNFITFWNWLFWNWLFRNWLFWNWLVDDHIYTQFIYSIVESLRDVPYGYKKFARMYVLSAHYIALIRAI
jgi:hypothetical protein